MKRRRSGILLGVLSWVGSHRMLISEAACAGVDTPITIQDQSGLNTLRAAVNCTNGGEVEARWVGSLTVDVSVTIGSGTFLTVSGRESAEARGGTPDARMFYVSSSAGLTVSNMTLSDGVAIEGGAIYSNLSTVSIESCVFRDNTATEGGGGAISATGGSLTIVNSIFINNVASEKGGAVQAMDLVLQVSDETLFRNNKASEGGGVFCAGSYSLSPQSTASCSFDGVSFESNNSSTEVELDFGDWGWESPFSFPWGGGGLSLAKTTSEVKRCTFDSNIAQLSGGGLFAGEDANLTVDSCTFFENRCKGYGGGMTAGTATIAGDTLFDSNWAGRDGAGVFLWNPYGLVDFNFATCRDNVADDRGGCMFTRGITTVGEEVVMSGDSGGSGGCIYAFDTSNTVVEGGTFTCSTSGNGAFLYAGDGGVVNVTGGLVTGCVAARRAGVAYCKGDESDLVGAKVTISGGTFVDNQALELGGALTAFGTTVNVLGGIFSNNTARYYGGFVFLEEQASIVCDGATIRENYAGDQGGGVYARDAVNVNLSRCDLLDNVSPQGAAAYLTHIELASFDNLNVSGNIPSSGSSVFIAESVLIADRVNFDARNASALDATNRAVQSDASSSFHAYDCTFEDWDGDTVVSHGGQSSGSLKLNSCDFRGSSSSTVVISSQSEAEIRNAHVSQDTFDNAIDPFALVDNALSCSSQGACGDGACVNSSLGVLCYCLPPADGGACLDDGPTLRLEEESAPADATIYPQNVEFTLAVYADTDGSTDAIWEVTSSSDRLELSVVPSSGVISPGEKIVIAVTGVAVDVNTGGDVTNNFVLRTVKTGSSSGSSSSTGVEIADTLSVTSAVYLCDAFEVAMPGNSSLVSCEQCSGLEGAEGVDCEDPGATLERLHILRGYWRSSTESETIHQCNFPDACAGGTEVTTSDDYCAPGHVGPYCAVCDQGYGRGVGDMCHSCDGVQATLLFTVGSVFFLFLLCFLALTVVFLIGGLDAVDSVRETMVSMVTFKRRASSRRRVSARVEDGNSVSSKGSTKGESFRSAMINSIYTGRRELRSDGGRGEHKRCDVEDNGPRREEPQQAAGETADSGMRDAFYGEAQPAPVASAMTPARAPSRPLLVNSGGKGSDRKRERMLPLSHDPPDDVSSAVNEDKDEPRSGCCGLGNVIKRWMSRLPLDKLKILVVVWQILTVFPSIASVEFPPIYANFLSWIDVVNLDLGRIFSASCLITNVTHYERLLAVTLIPLLLGLALVMTYRMALGRAGIGRAGISARRAAFSRHMAAGLLLTFLVFTSTSTMIFRTFPCDYAVVNGKGYLMADYSVECDTLKHTIFRVYAVFMMLIYPIGIPVMYFYILWSNRESLNPKLAAANHRAEVEAERAEEGAEESGSGGKKCPVPAGYDDAKELEEKIRRRGEDPKLVPSMFLWKDFGPDLYYYEVIECGRRILLTGVLIFIKPQSSTQAAMACIFAFASLLGFELLRPHLDPMDCWLYRLGCVVIFLSNFLALLIKVDAAGSGQQNALGVLMVLVNIILVVAVIVTSWFATQQSVDESRSDDNTFAVVRNMVTVERLGSAHHLRSTKIEPSSSTTPVPIGTVSPSLCIRPIASNDPDPARGMRFSRGNGGHVGGGAVGKEPPGSAKRTRVRTRGGKDIAEELWRKSQES